MNVDDLSHLIKGLNLRGGENICTIMNAGQIVEHACVVFTLHCTCVNQYLLIYLSISIIIKRLSVHCQVIITDPLTKSCSID